MSRDPTLEEDLDLMRDVYMTDTQRGAFNRIVRKAGYNGLHATKVWLDETLVQNDSGILEAAIKMALSRKGK